MAAVDKHWAKNYILDPLTAPVPSEETGLGSHFRSTFAPQPSDPTPPSSAGVSSPNSRASKNPFRRSSELKDGTTVRARANSNPPSSRRSYPNTPTLASPRQANYRQDAFAAYADDSPRAGKTPGSPNSPKQASKTRSRGSSLGERFPGDRSGKPLEILRRESKRASRAPHLKKKHMPGADVIDKLDAVPGQTYHHEGPYDAALLARNTSWESSPLAAVQGTNEEALKATPRENIIDAVERHRPLDGTAYIPPGGHDRFGRVYEYEEGSNMMIDNGGNYKRWPGIQYHPDDIKGKGEPSFTIDRALKEQKLRGDVERPNGDMELQERPLSRDTRDPAEIASGQQQYADTAEASASGSGAGGSKRNSFGALKRRIGSLRRKKDAPA